MFAWIKKSLPGSDLDKGYVIIEGNDIYKSDEQLINDFNKELWFNLDQRLVSLNHPDTFPSVYTKKQIKDRISNLDNITKDIIDRTGSAAIIAAAGAILGDLLLGPFGVPLGLLATSKFLGDSDKYEKIKKSNETYPYTAAEFNREVAKRLSTSAEKSDAKNFAFFIETVDANLKNSSWGKNDTVFDDIRNSSFVKNSNVTQIGAW